MGVNANDFVLFDKQEKDNLLYQHNNSQVTWPADKTITELFEAQVHRSPHAVAWTSGKFRMTYRQLNEQSNQLARYLCEACNVSKGEVVGIYMNRSGAMITVILGILKAGAIYVPVDIEYPEERVKYILNDAAAVLCIASEDHGTTLLSTAAGCTVKNYSDIAKELGHFSTENIAITTRPHDLVYIMYTSGSTGNPKGVAIEHHSLVNYCYWANGHYFGHSTGFPFALFTSIAFDLTCTAIFSTLLRGDAIIVYDEQEISGLLLQLFSAGSEVRVVKLTPSHISILNHLPVTDTKITCAIVGGEALTTGQVRTLKKLNPAMRVYNEYGPTEATVGCMIEEVDENCELVTIGKPISNSRIYILDDSFNPLPVGVSGELCIAGEGLARGYINNPALTASRFCEHPYEEGNRLYRSGDLARRLPDGRIELLGRKDTQVKIRGYRIELNEIESVMAAHPAIISCVAGVLQVADHTDPNKETVTHCTRCGIASNYPDIQFNDQHVCSMCLTYDQYKEKAKHYFKDISQLENIFEQIKASATGAYDCLMLYSGGKDSTYVLCRLVKDFKLRVLAFSFDNGFISGQAKANIVRVTRALGVDHVFGTTLSMNEIFVDSLKRYSNVCEGCFKTIYTLGIAMAREKNIPAVITGLSRGQLYETRLYQFFGAGIFDADEIDQRVTDARKAYHRMDDAVKRLLDTGIFTDGNIFDEVRIIDFFRFSDVGLKEMYEYLDRHVPWVRPSDTGRSTNCLINDLGIYVHKKQKGFHNYALPYSWDVRMGHKTRSEAMEELDDRIDESSVKKMMQEIGYEYFYQAQEQAEKYLVLYYVSVKPLADEELRFFVQQKLPVYMVPSYFVWLNELPLTTNGKINRQLLPGIDQIRNIQEDQHYTAPETDIEKAIAAQWQQVLKLEKAGIHSSFFSLGGSSVRIIMLYERISKLFPRLLKISDLFDNPTIAMQAALVQQRTTKSTQPDTAGFNVIEL